MPQGEAIELARKEHVEHGHWGRDMIKLQLIDRICSPRLDRSVTTAILECGQCKNFGATHLNSLLEPIIRRHPFELFVADYLTMPKSKGGFTNVLLIIDTYSQFVWGFKLKNHGTAKSTVAGLESIRHNFSTPETLMTDGGKHFDNEEVKIWCEKHDTNCYVTPAYAPWINGLVEGTNKLLLGRLKHMCAPHLGEDNTTDVDPESVTTRWSDHFETAIKHLNTRILPSFKFSPKELLLGLVINTPRTPLNDTTNQPTPDEAHVHSAYVSQQRNDALANAVANAIKRKAVFSRRVVSEHQGEVVFEPGQLVQVYASDIDSNFKASRKIIPRWSAPR